MAPILLFLSRVTMRSMQNAIFYQCSLSVGLIDAGIGPWSLWEVIVLSSWPLKVFRYPS